MSCRLRFVFSPIMVVFWGLVSFSAGPVRAQQPEEGQKSFAAHTGSVEGYVSFDETKLPARFAVIVLVPKPDSTDAAAGAASPGSQGATGHKEAPRVMEVRGSSGMDGRFRLDGVPAGDYLVAALVPGYVTPGVTVDMDATEEQLKSLIAALPAVHVGEGQVGSVNLTLHHGAVIGGRVQFADGSPAPGLQIAWGPDEDMLLRADRRLTVQFQLQQVLAYFDPFRERQNRLLTDDEGRYRIIGLLPGRYVVSTVIALDHSAGQLVTSDGGRVSSRGGENMHPEDIVVYEPGVFRRKDAKVFDIHRDEQVMDADMKIDPTGLHALRGKILAGEDRHAPVAILRLREVGSKEENRVAEIEDDGTFQINYLPAGSYTLTVMANDAPTRANDAPTSFSTAGKSYKIVQLPVVVGDHDVLLDDILVMPLKPGEEPDYSLFY